MKLKHFKLRDNYYLEMLSRKSGKHELTRKQLNRRQRRLEKQKLRQIIKKQEVDYD